MSDMPEFIANDPSASDAYAAGMERAEFDFAHPEQQKLPLPRVFKEIRSAAGKILLSETIDATPTATPARAVLGSRAKKWEPSTAQVPHDVAVEPSRGYLEEGRLARDRAAIPAIQAEQARQAAGRAYRLRNVPKGR